MYVIGIIGISCSGKSTLSEKLQDLLGKDQCLLLSMDDYFKELTEEQSKVLYNEEAEINFDCPEAVDFDQLVDHMSSIQSGKEISVPRYDLGSCVVTKHEHVPAGKYKYLIVEGVFLMCDERVKRMLNLSIWIEACDYVCALRRFIKYSRDIQGYSFEFIYNQCVKFVIPG